MTLIPSKTDLHLRRGSRAKVFALCAICFFLSMRAEIAVAVDDTAEFRAKIQPLLQKYCIGCHSEDDPTSGIRLDVLTGEVPDERIKLWEIVRRRIVDGDMPPEEELQPTRDEVDQLNLWVERALHNARSRPIAKNGVVRRLTVAQYRNTLRDLLGIDEDLTEVLPPDGISKLGFSNNSDSMQLSPLQLEAYFSIAEQALNLCVVEEHRQPTIQNFRVDLGKAINEQPCADELILGANSHLLDNQDFKVEQLVADRSFQFKPYFMRTNYRFHEGYEGNATVRGWREYDSIYHAVFACMRGTPGYPKGRAYEAIADGLLLRPAIPSHELFGVESTYGPKANFKVSLRELPSGGNFRVTVRAAKYDDGLLLAHGEPTQEDEGRYRIEVFEPTTAQTVNVREAGIYQVDIDNRVQDIVSETDASQLNDELVGYWSFDENGNGVSNEQLFDGQLTTGAQLVDSPFGKALSVDGVSGSVVIDRDDAMNVADGEFTIAAWIRPHELRQGGIVCLGKYSWTHGWYFDMPNDQGVLRIESANPNNQSNGTVASAAGMIRSNVWQHVAAVVRRGTNETTLFINGYPVAKGTIHGADLDNPSVQLHIGRIQDSKLFKGDIDEVRFYRRALGVAEIQALVEPGRQFANQPMAKEAQPLELHLGDRSFTGNLTQPAFAVVRLSEGPLEISTLTSGKTPIGRVLLTRLEEDEELARRFARFEQRNPILGVHLGLRRDCGSTFSRVGTPTRVASTEFSEFHFVGAINDFPSPDVQPDNDNYLAGIREIGVRSEYTDGRDMPRLLIGSVEFEGPFYESWPPDSHQRIFIESSHKHEPPVYAREIIRSFGERAYRRPLANDEEQSILAVWQASYDATGEFQQSISDALLFVLVSPQFLFLVEQSDSPEAEPLSAHELASKLSYFLWNTAPDDELLSHARTNELHERLTGQIDRMIDDERFESFVHEFTTQWLGLKSLEVVDFDVNRFPDLTREAKQELQQEPIRYLQYLIRNNLPASNLVESDFTLANEVVASYYGLAEKADTGFEFVPIRHSDERMGGLLTHAGILAALSDGRESNPVKRGAWLARKIIAEPPDDPPPNVPDLDQDLKHLSLREKLELHRNQRGCLKCHAGIDPWGIPLEELDAGGLFKQEAIDSSAELPDGYQVADLRALQEYLANERIDQVAFSFLKHLAEYAVGRSLTYNEIEFLRMKGLELKPKGYPMREMVHFVVTSDLFLTK